MIIRFIEITFFYLIPSLSATVTEATEAVKAMSPSRRKCLLPEETETELYTMKMFKEYKKSSCLLECQARQLLKGGLPAKSPF